MPIEGVIAGIVDRSTLIINKGAKDGVKRGMRFVVFTLADEVADPETGQPLGRWELVKGHLEAAHVQEAMTVCSSASSPGEEKGAEDSTKTLSSEMIAVSRMGRARPGAGGPAVDTSRMVGMPTAGPITVGDRVRSLEGA